MEEEKEGSKPSWNPKGGRPKKQDKDKRDKQLLLKFTEEERDSLYKECDEMGWKNRNAYFRRKLLAKGNGMIQNPKILFAKLNELSPQLKKVGTNINQIAKYVNYLDANDIIDPRFIADYNEHFKQMAEVQRQYAIAIKAYLRSMTDARE